jgi:hypothetical protein
LWLIRILLTVFVELRGPVARAWRGPLFKRAFETNLTIYNGHQHGNSRKDRRAQLPVNPAGAAPLLAYRQKKRRRNGAFFISR